MNVFTTHYFKPDGSRWSGNRILATNWEDAELIASLCGVIVTGKLVMDFGASDDGSDIDYSTIRIYKH